MRWKNPLSSGLKRSIESLPDRVMQGFGVGMEISRMRAAREQAAQDRANEAARYRQETARRAQERQQDIDWRAGQANTSAEQWAAEQAFRQRAFEAQQAEAERERKAREAAAEAARLAAPAREQREGELHAAKVGVMRSQAASNFARAKATNVRAQQLKDTERKQDEATRQFIALSTEARNAARALVELQEQGADDSEIFKAYNRAQKAREHVEAASQQLDILEAYRLKQQQDAAQDWAELQEDMARIRDERSQD
jgi:hypothetical protein